MARDYKKEYKNYQGKPAQIKKRAMRNAANRMAKRLGLIKKGSQSWQKMTSQDAL